MMSLLNSEEIKVEGIGEVKLNYYDGWVRKLGEVRYVLILKINFIFVGRMDGLSLYCYCE